MKNKQTPGNPELPNYDAIIIGAGMGGLVCGNLLAYKGYKVLIVEKNHDPGGYCTHFTRKGYTFDAAVHFFNGCEPGGMVFEILKKFNAEDCVEFIKLDEIFHWVNPKYQTDFHAPTSLQEYVDRLADLFPNDAENIRKFYKKYTKVAKFMLAWIKAEGLTKKIFLVLGNLLTFVLFLRCFKKTVADIIAPYVKSSNTALYEIMTALSVFFSLAPEKLSALTFLVGTLCLFIEGAYYPRGGTGNFSRALADIFVKRGGTLMLQTEATRVIFSDKKVTGIVVKDKRGQKKKLSTRVLVSNSDVTTLVTDLCPTSTFPASYLQKINSRNPATSAVMVYVGLNLDLKKYNITEYEYWAASWGGDNSPELIEYAINTADYSKLYGGPLSITSNIDPTCCPPGKSVFTTIYYAISEPFKKVLDEGERRGDQYKALKAKIAEQFISQISHALSIPDLAEHIEVIEVATPITMKRYTQCRDGSCVGWEVTPEQMMAGQVSQKTPVPNLFLCGQWAGFGGGISPVMTSGDVASHLASKYLAKKIKK
jgi:phytoene dehydrogenase-like protein